MTLYASARRHWRPRDSRPMQEWCDEHLHLSTLYASMAGPWDTIAFPHQRGVMALLNRPQTRQLALCWGTRLGKTVMLKAFTTYVAKNDPGPAMFASADREDVIRWFNETYTMLDECHETKDMLLAKHDRRFPVMDLHDMLLFGAWSGSPMTLGGRSVKYLQCSEFDKWARDKSNEASGPKIVKERVKDHPNHKIIIESTPSLEGQSNIEDELRDSDVVLNYHVPCPHCGRFQTLEMGTEGDGPGVKWERGAKGESDPTTARNTAYYRCAHCSGKILDEHRGAMLRRGVWAPEGYRVPSDTPASTLYLLGERNVKRIGLRLSSLYSPPPFMAWGQVAEAFILAKRGGIQGLQNFTNGWLAKAFAHSQDRPQWDLVRARFTEQIPRGVVPSWCVRLVAGIDCHAPTQRGNIYCILACGPGGRAHIVEIGEVRGELRDNVASQIQISTAAVLDGVWQRQDGSSMRVDLACIDSGGTWTYDVYLESWRRGTRLRAIKGAGGSGARRPWEARPAQADPNTGRVPPSGLMYFQLDSNFWKGLIVGRLTQAERSESSLTLHEGMDDATIQQLCNVFFQPRINARGQTVNEFQTGDPVLGDHAHDALCYAFAAADMTGVLYAQAAAVARPPAPRPPQRQDSSPRSGRQMDLRQIDRRR